MRKAILTLLLFLLLIPLYPAYAAPTIKPAIDKMDDSASKAAVLKANLLKFKDQKKAALVEKINDTLAMINKKRTDQMNKNLDTMSKILSRLETYVNELTGKDTTDAKKAIADAKSAITIVRTAVDAQSKKDYTLEATSEAIIRTDAKAARDSLHKDLKATRKLVIDAKQAVAYAIEVAAITVKGNKNGP